jgi:hypothetical protein
MNRARQILVYLLVAGGVTGLFDPYFEITDYYDFYYAGTTILILGLIFAWYHIDSDMQGYERSVWMNVFVVAIAIVAIPMYLFASRGARRGARAFSYLLLYTFVLLLIVYIGISVGLYLFQPNAF